MSDVIYDPDAEAELFHNIRYFERKRPGLGLEFHAAVVARLDEVLHQPTAFAYFRKTEMQKARVDRFRTTIYFVQIKSGLWIAAIRGDGQDDSWLSRTRPYDIEQ